MHRFHWTLAAVVMGGVMAGGSGLALGPHELLLLINTNVEESVRIGEFWARLRKVPDSNVIRLGVPLRANEDGTLPDLSPEEFRQWIWGPAMEKARQREIAGHILAWVYAPGFPWRIKGDPMLSLTGLTFLRGGAADTGAVQRGVFFSSLYAGPSGPGQPVFSTRSLDVWMDWMRPEDRPMPGWVLAHIGRHGLTEEEAVAMLVRGADADGARPEGGICIVTNQDVRSRAREWQWEGVVSELKSLGVPVFFRSSLPRQGPPIWGILVGMARFDAEGVPFQRGAIADHLTSHGAYFQNDGQTRCTAWLKAGAVAAGGTVVEPYAIWSKFPHARLFVHMARGCTALEGFYQSLRMPLQYLPMGDPLAAPFRPKGEVRLEPLGGEWGWRVRVEGSGTVPWSSWILLADGVPVAEGKLEEVCRLPAEKRNRELRVVVRSAGLIRHQVFVVREGEKMVEGER